MRASLWIAVTMVGCFCPVAAVPVCRGDEIVRARAAALPDDDRAGDRVPVAGQSKDGSLSPQIGIGPPPRDAGPAAERTRPGRSAGGQGPELPGKICPGERRHPRAGRPISTYETCIAMVCFQEANRDGRYDQTIHRRGGVHSRRAVGRKQGKDKSIRPTAVPATAASRGRTSRTPPFWSMR